MTQENRQTQDMKQSRRQMIWPFQIPMCLAILFQGIRPKRNEYRCPQKNRHFYKSSLQYYSLQWKSEKNPNVPQLMNGYTTPLHLNNEVLFSNKKDALVWGEPKNIMLSEISQTLIATYFKISCIWNVQISNLKRKIRGCLGLEVEG